MTLKLSLLMILVLFFSSTNAEQVCLSIRKDDLVVKELTVKQLRQLQNNLTSLTVDNPADSNVYVYQGILLKTLLTRFLVKIGNNLMPLSLVHKMVISLLFQSLI